MKKHILLLVGLLLTGCELFTDTYELQSVQPSPDHQLEARIVHRKIADPYSEHWVLQISEPNTKITGWDDVVFEFPIDSKIESLTWRNDRKLEVEYRKGKSELSLVHFRSPPHGVTVELKEKK